MCVYPYIYIHIYTLHTSIHSVYTSIHRPIIYLYIIYLSTIHIINTSIISYRYLQYDNVTRVSVTRELLTEKRRYIHHTHIYKQNKYISWYWNRMLMDALICVYILCMKDSAMMFLQNPRSRRFLERREWSFMWWRWRSFVIYSFFIFNTSYISFLSFLFFS